jgi:hypothetical protein
VNDEFLAPWMEPTITSLRMADAEPMLTKCVKWIKEGGTGWRGPKLLVPDEVPLYVGGSTGPMYRAATDANPP